MEEDGHKPDVVGLKQVLRALEAGELSAVYVADDAEERLRRRVIESCEQNGAEVLRAESMSVLGCACGIDVGAAAAGFRKKAGGNDA